MLGVSRRDAVEQEVVNNLLFAHKRIAGSGNVTEISRLTRIILRLIDKRKDKLTYVSPEGNQGGSQNPV